MEREEGDGEKRHVRSGLQKRTLVKQGRLVIPD
jgi:hypothetical protein